MLICNFCDKECKNDNSLRNHQRLCKSNAERQTTPFQNVEFQQNKPGGNLNQYSNAVKLGLPKPIVSESTRKKFSNNVKSRSPEWNAVNGLRVAKTIQAKVVEGTWHTSLARHMHIDYKGNDLHGTWELAYAIYLDTNNIKWIRNKDSFSYEFNGKERKYTPDFYLIETDEYIEIKGYKTEKDVAKWKYFPKHRSLRVLMKKELTELGIL